MVGGVGLTGFALEIDVGEVDDARERLVLPEQTCGGLTPDRDRDDRIALVKHVRGPELCEGGSAATVPGFPRLGAGISARER